MKYLSLKVTAWLLLTAAVAIFATLHFRLYRCCEFRMIPDWAVFAAIAAALFFHYKTK